MTSMRAAYKATSNGISVYRTTRQFEVPESTLRDRKLMIIDQNASLGTSTLLTECEERDLADHINYMTTIGYGYSRGASHSCSHQYG